MASIDEAVAAPGYRIYNLGGSRTTTLLGLVELLGQALGKKPIVEWQPEQPGDMKRTLADVTLSGRALGYAPKVSMEEGIARFVAWLRAKGEHDRVGARALLVGADAEVRNPRVRY